MPREPRKRCDQCGRQMARASLVVDGKSLCVNCTGKVCLMPCIGCGGNTRKRNDAGEPFCRTCRTKGRHCARCAKLLPRASLMTPDGAVCQNCAQKYYRDPEVCEQCGQMALPLTAVDTSAGRLRVCAKCWRKHNGYTACAVCRLHRRPAGQLPDGRPICKVCVARGGTPFVCPRCGQEGKSFSQASCQTCYDRDRVRKKVNTVALVLRQEWAKQAWLAFGTSLAEDFHPFSALQRIDRYFLLFARLDAAFSRTSEVTPEALLTVVGGRDGLRRNAVPYGFLVKSGYVPEMTRALLDDTAEQMRQRALLADIDGQWYAPTVMRFHANLQALHERYSERGWKGKQSRMRMRTITQNLGVAIRFCQMLDGMGVAMIQQVAPNHLDAFQAQHPGSRNSIRAFVRYLNRHEKLFSKLRIITVRQDLPDGIFLSRERYLELLRAWLSPSDETLRESLIGLLMMLYAQSVTRLVALRMSDLVESRNGQFRIALARTEIALDPNVSALMRRWLEVRRAITVFDDVDQNPYLFPGRRVGEHITPSGVTYWLRKAGVTAEQLYSTAIFNAYRNGVRLPKVLMNAFGITKTTAIKYMSLIDPRLVDEVEARVA